METTYVELRYLPRVRWAALRELRGCDQQLARGADTAVAIRLLDSLLVDTPGPALQPGMAARLPAADRDGLLAAVYLNTYGPRIAGVIACTACGQRFEIDFDLPSLRAALPARAMANHGELDGHLTYRLDDGRVVRLPTGEDELAVWRLAPADAFPDLLRRCVVEGEWSSDPQAVEAAMQAVAPLLDTELEAHCPECATVNTVAFNIQHFLLEAIAAEQPQLNADVHRIASAYGWDLATILDLPRRDRRAYVALIEGDASRMDQRMVAL